MVLLDMLNSFVRDNHFIRRDMLRYASIFFDIQMRHKMHVGNTAQTGFNWHCITFLLDCNVFLHVPRCTQSLPPDAGLTCVRIRKNGEMDVELSRPSHHDPTKWS